MIIQNIATHTDYILRALCTSTTRTPWWRHCSVPHFRTLIIIKNHPFPHYTTYYMKRSTETCNLHHSVTRHILFVNTSMECDRCVLHSPSLTLPVPLPHLLSIIRKHPVNTTGSHRYQTEFNIVIMVYPQLANHTHKHTHPHTHTKYTYNNNNYIISYSNT